jgi:hypothetical protein
VSTLLMTLRAALEDTALSSFVRNTPWAWPVCESLHFVGMSMLAGTVGIFDLRLLGIGRRVPIGALHRLIPIGVAGFALNAATGLCFLAGTPDQYLYNVAFGVKTVLLTAAGVNVAFFYARVFRRLDSLAPGEPTPWAARLAGAVSLSAWIGVMAAGRLLTFYRPFGSVTE